MNKKYVERKVGFKASSSNPYKTEESTNQFHVNQALDEPDSNRNKR
jgi:hypothetical protein